MLALFETPAGYAIFKLLDEKKLSQTENLYNDFKTPESASKVVKLKHFEKFQDTTEALAATTATVEGKLSKMLKKVIKKHVASEEVQGQLLVADAKLGNAIKDKFQLSCVSNSAVQELMRCIRYQLEGLLAGLPKKDMTAMALGLAHSLSRYKLKFSPDKVDTMIVQAVCLLDDLDKELNNYIMRCREWYGWHFPELGKIVTDNTAFINTVKLIGTRENTANTDLSDILPEDIEERVKEAAEISMGTEISEDDIQNILKLCNEITEMSAYRTQLYNYLSARMMAMAPNLTTLVGELIGARLISKSGSLINLAKAPASTLQILGAEKALFRALKTKKDTPKYGLIYHSALVTSATTKNKGKISRMLSTKASLCTRLDAMGEDNTLDLGAEHKVKLEAKLRLLEEGNLRRLSGTGKAKAKFEKYHGKSEIHQYPTAADSTLPTKRKYSESEDKKPLIEELSSEITHKSKKIKKEAGFETPVKVKQEEPEEDEPTSSKKKKKAKAKEAEGAVSEPEVSQEVSESGKKKKKRKYEQEEEEEVAAEVTPTSERKKKKKQQQQEEEAEAEEAAAEVTPTPEKKKKKKKKKSVSED